LLVFHKLLKQIGILHWKAISMFVTACQLITNIEATLYLAKDPLWSW